MSCRYSVKKDPNMSDQVLIWDNSNNDWRVVSFTDILALFEDSNSNGVVQEANTQYAAPAVTAFTILINANDEDTHLIMTPANALADGAITLPANTLLRDKQTVLVNCTKQITNFVVNANGAVSVYGAPSSLGADDFFKLKYDLIANSWYRIG